MIITDAMAYAFHHALSDSALGSDDIEEIKHGLRAAFANVVVTLPEIEKWRSVDAVRAQCAYKFLVSITLTGAGITTEGV